jgi:hypothetical protein
MRSEQIPARTESRQAAERAIPPNDDSYGMAHAGEEEDWPQIGITTKYIQRVPRITANISSLNHFVHGNMTGAEHYGIGRGADRQHETKRCGDSRGDHCQERIELESTRGPHHDRQKGRRRGGVARKFSQKNQQKTYEENHEQWVDIEERPDGIAKDDIEA